MGWDMWAIVYMRSRTVIACLIGLKDRNNYTSYDTSYALCQRDNVGPVADTELQEFRLTWKKYISKRNRWVSSNQCTYQRDGETVRYDKIMNHDGKSSVIFSGG